MNESRWDVRINYTPNTQLLPMKIRNLPPLTAPLQADLAEVLRPVSTAQPGEVLAFRFTVRIDRGRVTFDSDVDVILADERSDAGMKQVLLRHRKNLLQDCAVVSLQLLSEVERSDVLYDALCQKADPLLSCASRDFGYSVVATAAGVVAIPYITQVRGYEDLRPEEEVLVFAFEGISNHARLELARELGKIACRCSPFLLAYDIVEERLTECAA
jgi:hypothetical protein